MATADEEATEGDSGGLEVEETKDHVGQASVGGEGYGRCVGTFAHREGGGRRNRESTPEDVEEDSEGEEGGTGPSENILFICLSLFPLASVFLFFIFFWY